MDTETRTDSYESSLTITTKPSFGYQGIIPSTPMTFEIEICDEDYEDYTLSVYVDGSRSLPYTEDSTTLWSHLKPRWRFLDSSLSAIEYDTDITFNTEILDSDGNTTGAIGEVVIYFVDDLPTTYVVDSEIVNSPVLLWFSIGDRSESEIKKAVSYIVKPIKPEYLTISTDGDSSMLSSYSAGADIQTYFTIHGTHDDFPDQAPIIFDIPNSYNPHILGTSATSEMVTIDEITSGDLEDIEIDITFSIIEVSDVVYATYDSTGSSLYTDDSTVLTFGGS